MKKQKMRYAVAVLNGTLLSVLALLGGGVLAGYATAFESRFLGFLASSLPFLALILTAFASKMLLKEKSFSKKPEISLPNLREMLFAGAMTAATLLVIVPLRLWSDKLLSLVGYSPVNDYLLMNSLLEAALFLLVVFPLFCELQNRFLLQPIAEKLFHGWKFYLIAGLSYFLTFPRLQNALSSIALGIALAVLWRVTGKRILCYISSLAVQIVAFLYSIILSYGISDGSAMGYLDLSGITLIFFSVATAVLLLLWMIQKKKKPRPWDIGAALLLFVFSIVIGIALAGS